MSVSTFLTPDIGISATWDAKSLFRNLGEELGGTDVPTPSLAVFSASWNGGVASATAIAQNAPGISPNSVVVITGYTGVPSGTWSVAINPTTQQFQLTSTSASENTGYNWFIIG